MKKILSILFVFACATANAQSPPFQKPVTYGYEMKHSLTTELLGIPQDTFTVATILKPYGWIAIKDGTLYKWVYADNMWEAISGGGGGGVTSVGSGFGLLGGPITTAGTLRVDTTSGGVASWLRLKKIIDSLSAGALSQNWANTNLTVTANRTHDMNNKTMTFNNNKSWMWNFQNDNVSTYEVVNTKGFFFENEGTDAGDLYNGWVDWDPAFGELFWSRNSVQGYLSMNSDISESQMNVNLKSKRNSHQTNINLYNDSLYLDPYNGNMTIQAMRMANIDTAGYKPMVWNIYNHSWRYFNSWGEIGQDYDLRADGNTTGGTNNFGAITSGNNNFAIGSNLGNTLTSGSFNILVGVLQAPRITTANDIISIGYNNFKNINASTLNSAPGINIGHDNNGYSKYKNFAIGAYNNGYDNDSATAVNYQMADNFSIGVENLMRLRVGVDNMTYGWDVMQILDSGSNNNGMGQYALSAIASGHFNSAFGHGAGWRTIGGDRNVFVGDSSGYGPGPGAFMLGNIFIGSKSRYTGTNLYNRITIGDSALNSQNNLAVIGKSGTFLAIGRSTATESIHTDGAIIIGAAAATTDGTIQWTGSDFQGRKGGVWKSFTAPSITDLIGLTSNSVYYVNNSGVITALALGANGTVLTSNGATSAPTFSAAGGSSTWNGITDPTGDQALTFQAGESSTWTDQNTTEDLFTVNNATSTTNSLFSLNRTSTALAAGNNIMELVSSGTNGTNAITATGLRIDVSNANATSGTNVGINVSASGATSRNIGMFVSNVSNNQDGIIISQGTTESSHMSIGHNNSTTNWGIYAYNSMVLELGTGGSDVLIKPGFSQMAAFSSSAFTTSSNIRITNGGRTLQKQGADVASAAGAIALGADGNSFEITGTAAITLISSTNWQNGSIVTFLFTSTATLTDGTANSGSDIGMELAGNTNFVASAGATITLLLSEIGGTQRWREIGRSVN